MKLKLNKICLPLLSAFSVFGMTSCKNEVKPESEVVVVEKEKIVSAPEKSPKESFILNLVDRALREKYHPSKDNEWWWWSEKEWNKMKLPIAGSEKERPKYGAHEDKEIYFSEHGISKLETRTEIDSEYASKLEKFKKYLNKSLDQYSKQESSFDSINDNFYSVFKYQFNSSIKDHFSFIKKAFVIDKNIPNADYLSYEWTNLFLLKNTEKIHEYANAIQNEEFKNEFLTNVLPVIEKMFVDYDAQNNPNFRVAIIPTTNNTMHLRNILVDKNNLNLIARMNYLNKGEVDKLNLLIVPLNYDLSKFNAPDHSSKNPNILDLDREFGTIEENEPKGEKLQDYLAGYVSDLYFDNFFYIYLDHFINGANYNVAINEQENLNDFLRLFAYKMNLSFNEASAFFNKIQTLQKLSDSDFVLLEKWLEQAFN
ncbi:hypothetical protein [Mycoplasmopsis gallinacea]|uniref:Lipoprotein n=1 Tax=Mycoplasmopsis gallinacea TaxID=29556 RepID=A0A6H0V1P8_9BACT|nr:hypothetical protein [Mycoplasmopsis gallinacea]QIW61898.1 hypothetical protein GOQ20_00200 [Mycoplasmopsis gallinacea]